MGRALCSGGGGGVGGGLGGQMGVEKRWRGECLERTGPNGHIMEIKVLYLSL